MSNGKSNLLHQGYTYFKHYITRHKARWSCTNYPKCKGSLYAGEDLVIESMAKEHNHVARQLHLTSDGVYIKL